MPRQEWGGIEPMEKIFLLTFLFIGRTRVSINTLCLLGQSNKAIGHESPIGPCVATHAVDNRQACCFRKRWAPSRQGKNPQGEEAYLRFARGDETRDSALRKTARSSSGLNAETRMGRY